MPSVRNLRQARGGGGFVVGKRKVYQAAAVALELCLWAREVLETDRVADLLAERNIHFVCNTLRN